MSQCRGRLPHLVARPLVLMGAPMSDCGANLTLRLSRIIEQDYGCKPGMVHEGYGAECASSAHAPALYRTFGCDHAAHLARVLLPVISEAEVHIGQLREARDRAERVVDRASRLADEWTTATCQTDGAPCSWHRVAAECAAELRAALEASNG